MARKNMSRRRRKTSRSRSRTYRRRHRASSRNRSRRHRASSRRRRSRTAGVNYSEELGELQNLLNNSYKLAYIDGDDIIPKVLRDATLDDWTKRNIDSCCDDCRDNDSSPSCYRQCVQSEIDRVKQVMVRDKAQDKIEKFLKKKIRRQKKNRALNTLQKVDAKLASQHKRAVIPLHLGRKIARYTS